jgi:antitoxin CptB
MAVNRGRVRWQCRRSLLELDLVLERFLAESFDGLDEDQLADLEDLLRCDDFDLWPMVNGSKPCEVERWKEMVARLQQC